KLLRCAKALNFLQSTENKLVEKYNSEELKVLICSCDVHSPKISDAEDNDENNNKYINSPLHQSRQYNDEIYYIKNPVFPTDAPDWAVKPEIRKHKWQTLEVENNKK
ncbi:11828_t:CDS:2, partial [Racocetra persica]